MVGYDQQIHLKLLTWIGSIKLNLVTVSMELPVPEDLIEQFNRDGAVCLRNVFDQKWVEIVTKGIENNIKNPSEYGKQVQQSEQGAAGYFDDYCNWKQIDEIKDFVYNSPAASIALNLMRSSEAVFYHEHILVKEAGSTKETPWHVDQSYYPINGTKVCSLWMPIDSIGLDSTIEFVAGSHLWPKWFIPRKFATFKNYNLNRAFEEMEYYETVPSDEELRNNYKILKWEVNPGDCIAFHMKTLHGAPGNLSKLSPRRILSTRWLGDDAVIASRPWEISPPTTGGRSIGEKPISDEFPLILTK